VATFLHRRASWCFCSVHELWGNLGWVAHRTWARSPVSHYRQNLEKREIEAPIWRRQEFCTWWLVYRILGCRSHPLSRLSALLLWLSLILFRKLKSDLCTRSNLRLSTVLTYPLCYYWSLDWVEFRTKQFSSCFPCPKYAPQNARILSETSECKYQTSLDAMVSACGL